eukprot:1449258-Rhodomonas_salina.1
MCSTEPSVPGGEVLVPPTPLRPRQPHPVPDFAPYHSTHALVPATHIPYALSSTALCDPGEVRSGVQYCGLTWSLVVDLVCGSEIGCWVLLLVLVDLLIGSEIEYGLLRCCMEPRSEIRDSDLGETGRWGQISTSTIRSCVVVRSGAGVPGAMGEHAP